MSGPVAPTDDQLRYLAKLCADRNLPQLVVGSKDDCSEAISAILRNDPIAAWLFDSAGVWQAYLPPALQGQTYEERMAILDAESERFEQARYEDVQHP